MDGVIEGDIDIYSPRVMVHTIRTKGSMTQLGTHSPNS